MASKAFHPLAEQIWGLAQAPERTLGGIDTCFKLDFCQVAARCWSRT